MESIVDFGSVLLFDRSRVASPYVRLLVTATDQELVRGSPWVSVNKRDSCRGNAMWPERFRFRSPDEVCHAIQ